MTLALRSGEIWLANLNPTRGTETGKTRPVAIVQNQALLDAAHPSTIVMPLTTQLIDDTQPLRYRIPARDALRKDSELLIDQIRAIDNRRLTEGPLTTLTPREMADIYNYVLETMGATLKQREKLSSFIETLTC